METIRLAWEEGIKSALKYEVRQTGEDINDIAYSLTMVPIALVASLYVAGRVSYRMLKSHTSRASRNARWARKHKESQLAKKTE